jgi:hypothetical protein
VKRRCTLAWNSSLSSNSWRKKVVNRRKSVKDWRSSILRRHYQMLMSVSGAVRLKKEGKRWRMNLMSAGRGVATLSTKRLLPERHPQPSGQLVQVNRIPGRLSWKVTISVSQNKSMFLYY